jgi:hypothetical protein
VAEFSAFKASPLMQNGASRVKRVEVAVFYVRTCASKKLAGILFNANFAN